MAFTQISTKGIKDGTITGTDLATNVDLVDNKKIRFGTGNDMELFHDSSNSFLKNTTGNLVIRSDNRIDFQDAAGNESFAAFIDNGAVELYHDGTKRLETNGAGVEISSALGIANVGGSISGSGGGQDYFGIRDSAANFAFMVKTHGTNNGSVGIGTTSPAHKLHIKDSSANPLLMVERGSGATSFIEAQTDKGVFGTGNNHPVYFLQNSGTAMVIDTSKKVGIGTTTPDQQLQVTGIINRGS